MTRHVGSGSLTGPAGTASDWQLRSVLIYGCSQVPSRGAPDAIFALSAGRPRSAPRFCSASQYSRCGHAATLSITMPSMSRRWTRCRRLREATGIQVKVHSGDGPESPIRSSQEGGEFAGDIFFTRFAGNRGRTRRGCSLPVDPKPWPRCGQYSAPDGNWVGCSRREDVSLTHQMISRASCRILMDLADPAWKASRRRARRHMIFCRWSMPCGDEGA